MRHGSHVIPRKLNRFQSIKAFWIFAILNFILGATLYYALADSGSNRRPAGFAQKPVEDRMPTRIETGAQLFNNVRFVKPDEAGDSIANRFPAGIPTTTGEWEPISPPGDGYGSSEETLFPE